MDLLTPMIKMCIIVWPITLWAKFLLCFNGFEIGIKYLFVMPIFNIYL
jgi:hypothetical protein